MSVRTITSIPSIDRLAIGLEEIRGLGARGAIPVGVIQLVNPKSLDPDGLLWEGQGRITNATAHERLLATAYDDGNGVLWDGAKRIELLAFVHADQCHFSPSGEFLWIRQGRKVYCATAARGFQDMSRLELGTDREPIVWIGSSTRFPQHLLVVNANSDVHLLDPKTCRTPRVLGRCDGLADAEVIVASADGDWFSWIDANGDVRLWEVSRGAAPDTIRDLPVVSAIAFGLDNRVVAVACGAGDVVFALTDLPKATSRITFSDRSPDTTVTFSAAHGQFYVGTLDGTLSAVDVAVERENNR